MTHNTEHNNLQKKLERYLAASPLPMHMPGHKRNLDMLGQNSPFRHDITEIHGFDNLHFPSGIIRDIELKASDIWNASDAIISVNGSTALIEASIFSHTMRGDKILCAANCHISVWHACELGGLNPTVITPDSDSGVPFCGSINPESIKKALSADPSIKTVVITSPTYEGVISDTKAISEVVRRHGAILIVDEAHGAHLGCKGNSKFPGSSYGDVVIKSIHKTMAAPTQTAVLLINGTNANKRLIRHYMSVNESSSPSYVLMEGIDNALSYTDTDRFFDIVKAGRLELERKLKTLSLYSSDSYDISKLVILTNGSVTGAELSDRLRNIHNIEVEAAFPSYIIAMTGIGDTSDTIARFTEALISVDSDLKKAENDLSTCFLPSFREYVMSIEDAVKSKLRDTDLEIAHGRISAEYIFAYPPGVPLLLPGEVITDAHIEIFAKITESGIKLKTDPARVFDGTLLTVDTGA